jgi:hypothetical protein
MKRICDKCKNFEVSMDNTKEICHAKKQGSLVIPFITDDYISERMEGVKITCKGFEKIKLCTN